MLKSIAILICVLAGLSCLLVLADGRDWTRPAWEKLISQAVLSRPLSPAEAQAAGLEARVADVNRQFAAASVVREQLAARRGQLLRRLREQTAAVSTGQQPPASPQQEGRVYRVAVYGTTAGFDLKKRPGEFRPVHVLPCWQGGQFNRNVGRFVAPEIDVIFVGGDNTFSRQTAQAIEQAVLNGGKFLVINFWSQRNFDAGLPAINRGNASYGSHLVVVDPRHPAMAGLPTRFARQGPDFNRERCSAREGSTVLLRYADGDPALLYWRYGRGYVVEWTLEVISAFLPGDTADTINYRLLKMFLVGTDRGEPLPVAPTGAASTGVETAADPEQILKGSPIVAALVRSIDAKDRRDTELVAQQAELKTELERLEARLIGLRSGAALTVTDDPIRPSDGLRPSGEGPAGERYERILREAMGLAD